MSADEAAYSNYVVFGPDANCTLALCPAELSVYQYQPTLPGNICFLLLFAIAMIIHLVMGLKWRTWFFVFCMFWGCVSEIIGYAGRIMLHYNPFTFTGFLIQIICITLGPTWFAAAIYFTLYKIILYLGPQHARFPPKAYYWIFIPCDIISLLLQSVGGALSTTSDGSSDAAVNVSIAGLSFQVFTLLVFISLTLEYAWRWQRARKASAVKEPLSRRFKIFVTFLSAGTLLIFIRCIYRIDELSEGYSGDLIHNEGLFIGLEGFMVLVAVYCLIIAHPGPVFQGFDDEKTLREGSAGAHLERKNSETA
ncbi:MAG: hypothetical protein LQ348_006919 [Seirophora lacunosa]|nr:MAG: hypothetical protein LQ348_006919 [Seirophora lacunosa]